jgi:hypothetical protein
LDGTTVDSRSTEQRERNGTGPWSQCFLRTMNRWRATNRPSCFSHRLLSRNLRFTFNGFSCERLQLVGRLCRSATVTAWVISAQWQLNYASGEESPPFSSCDATRFFEQVTFSCAPRLATNSFLRTERFEMVGIGSLRFRLDSCTSLSVRHSSGWPSHCGCNSKLNGEGHCVPEILFQIPGISEFDLSQRLALDISTDSKPCGCA